LAGGLTHPTTYLEKVCYAVGELIGGRKIMKIKNGDMPAMPLDYQHHNTRGDYVKKGLSGLTKREQFAMAAMQGILSNPYWNEYGEYTPDAVSKSATEYADALLEQLENQND
jgi:hypothetical protein|tara:strand:- start:2250 stop:2585 length:336 start_codon:yes stop_codon:yes gene_type:complete